MVNLAVEFSDKKVTPFGGMSLMKRFVDALGIRENAQGTSIATRWLQPSL